MKFYKLALASVAAFGLAGAAMADDETVTPLVADGLEDWPITNPATIPQTGMTDEGTDGSKIGSVWFGAASEDTVVTAYGGDVAATSKDRPDGITATPNDKFLKVSNSSPLWRVFKAYTYDGDAPTTFPATPVTVPAAADQTAAGKYHGGLFIDTLVQFTPSEDAPTPEDGSKLIVWMNAESNHGR